MSRARNTNPQDQSNAYARPAHVPNLSYEEMSDLGRDLFDMSREYESSGEGLLTEEEIEIELTRRRGGYIQDDDAAA